MGKGRDVTKEELNGESAGGASIPMRPLPNSLSPSSYSVYTTSCPPHASVFDYGAATSKGSAYNVSCALPNLFLIQFQFLFKLGGRNPNSQF